jgi:hypothetical protein
MPDERYLLCRVERYAIAIGLDAVRHIGGTETTPDPGPSPVDLRTLLGVPAAGPGTAIAVRIGETDVSLIVEAVAGIETIGDSAFAPLPLVFEQARLLFDGAGRRPAGGQHALRLRLQPLIAPAFAPL